MRIGGALRRIVVIGLLVTACQPSVGIPTSAPSGSPPAASPAGGTPAPTAITQEPERLIADLRATGVDARIGQVYPADPFVAEGFVLCAGQEQVRLFVFPSIGGRMEATARIDPDNPSNVGTSMVTWNGRPRFWARDRLLILYLGEDAPTDTLLRTILGEPFASGEGRQLLPDDSCH